MQVQYQTGTDVFTGTSGQSDPQLPQVRLPANSRRALSARATIDLSQCTITDAIVVTLKLRRISGTPGDIAHSSTTIGLGVIATSGQNEVDVPVTLKPVIYDSSIGARDTIRMIVSLSAGPATGQIVIRDAAILVE
jgi:hypothetical protein